MNRIALAGLALLIGLGGSAPPADPQGAKPVYVTFDFNMPRITAEYGNHASAREAEIAVKLAQACMEHNARPENVVLPWCFVPGTTQVPRMRVYLMENKARTKWELKIDFIGIDKKGKGDTFSSEVLGEGTVQVRTPPYDDLPNLVETWFVEKVLNPQRGREFLARLKDAAPVGDGPLLHRKGVPQHVDDAKGVIALDFAKYNYLSKSAFLGVWLRKDGEVVQVTEIQSEGEQSAHEVKLPNGNRIQGILVRHSHWNKVKITAANVANWRRKDSVVSDMQ